MENKTGDSTVTLDKDKERRLRNLSSNPSEYYNVVLQIRNKEIKNIIQVTFVAICIIVIFLCLTFLEKYSILCSALVALSILLLHFDSTVLSVIYHNITNLSC